MTLFLIISSAVFDAFKETILSPFTDILICLARNWYILVTLTYGFNDEITYTSLADTSHVHEIQRTESLVDIKNQTLSASRRSGIFVLWYCASTYYLKWVTHLPPGQNECRGYHQMHFLELKYLYFHQNVIEVCSEESNWQWPRIGLDNGLVLNSGKPLSEPMPTHLTEAYMHH